ncbi:hypothetical protein [Erwinia billingiae]|uniref:hypothetical protein n=1 Tax=Erwinia billingiae TaxID=182337 RepID=UPI000D00EF26|nr:hypothetical protein [Erwinia billingiae]PRB58819.1 hypothetical protein CQ001_14765 [Erwinia billingiae]
MNFLSRSVVIASAFTLLCGCDNHPDRTLSPSPEAKWVNVTFRVPAGIALQPAELLYRSEQCKSVRYNSSNEPHNIPGYNDFEQPFNVSQGNNIQQLRVAVDGGGPCQWQLNSLRVSFRIADDNSLTKGKEIIDTSYIFDFGDYGLSDGYGTGRAKAFREKQLELKPDLFPMVFINHMFKKTTLKLFGGETDYEKWSRRYRLSATENIYINPFVHINKSVTLESPETTPGNIRAFYPDGSSEEIPNISPDYEKLLSMK